MRVCQAISSSFIVAVLFFTCLNTHVFAQEVDGPIAREHLKRWALALLYQERFAELEKTANQLRVDKATFPDGAVKLHFFYEAFSAPKSKNNDGWIRFMSKLKAWVAKYPNSTTARNALAFGWMNYGLEARGGGYANTVTAAGWRLLAERLDNAEALLEKKNSVPGEYCPERYDLLLSLAKAKGWEAAHFESIFHAAITFDLTYPHFYLQKAEYLNPKWHGNEGDWQRFAEETAKIPENGKILYMRLAWSQYLEGRFKSLEEASISWPLLKQGFIDARHSFPKSPWLLNNFCKFACLAGDKETARPLFLEIGDRPYIEAWNTTRSIGNVDDYKRWRMWALGNDKTGATTFPSTEGTEDFRETLILAKSGDAEAQYKVGNFLDRGEQVKQDRVEAEKWLRKAAEQGLRNAQMSLGMVYFNGWEPIGRDFKKAAQWYYIAAIQGDSNAASSLAKMYFDGFGLEQDLLKAYVWYSQITQWQEPKVKEIATKLTQEQLTKGDLEVNNIREKIRINIESVEIRPIDPDSIQVPELKLAPQIKYEFIPHLKLPTGNLLDGVKWQLSGGATFDGKTLSIKDQGEAATQLNVVSSSNGCVLVAARLRHARPEAIVSGAPFLAANMTDGKFEGQKIFMGLLAPPPNNRQEGPWYKTHEIKATRFDGVKLRIGTAGKQEGSSTEIYDTKVIIFPSCNEANKAGEEYLRK
jgi:hypothetical protein